MADAGAEQAARDGAPVAQLRHRRARWLRVLGGVVALAAIGFCVRELTDSWPSVRTELRHARLGWLAPALACATAFVLVLALQWWRWLLAFGIRTNPVDASAWYLGGELGKYLPGSVWTVLGRGELARRGGIARASSYSSTLLAYGTMCVAAGMVCGVAGPAMALAGGPGWGWLFAPLLVLAPAVVHPTLLRPVLAAARRLTGGRLDAPAPPVSTLASLVGWCAPAWVLLGVASLSLTRLLSLDASPSQIILAAVAAWTVGFLAVPVPAGAGVRELVFVALCGLPTASGAAVALLSRSSLLLVDAVLGATALVVAGRRAPGRIPAPAAAPSSGSTPGLLP